MRVRLQSTQSGAPSSTLLYVSPGKIRLGCKRFADTNTLAYISKVKVVWQWTEDIEKFKNTEERKIVWTKRDHETLQILEF